MTNFSHNGVDIELLPTGRFRTLINGKPLIGASLAIVKRKIDIAAKNDFKSFKCFIERGYRDEALDEVTVSGVKAPRKGASGYRNHHEFILSNGTERRQVMPSTPENRAAWEAWKAYKTESDRLAKERQDGEDEFLEKIKYVQADDYAPKRA